MRRRDFLAASAAAAGGMIGSAAMSFAADQGQGDRQLLELRTYRFANAGKQEAFERFLAAAAIPALNRIGVEPVGVFKLRAADNPELKLTADRTDLWILLPHDTFESVLTLNRRLGADQEFKSAGHDVLFAPKNDPAYGRFDSTLLLAMEGFPRVKVPTKAPGRVLQLRSYQSHNEERAANKLRMFNAGEFAIFEQAGMPGVFFGGALVGQDLPQLTYMIAHQDMQDLKKSWDAFFATAQWKELSGDASYKDNVSRVINLLLRPGDGSQI